MRWLIPIMVVQIVLLGCQVPETKVCGKVNVICIKEPCDPVRETFNSYKSAVSKGAYDIKQGPCIQSFTECVDSGNSIVKGFPRKCKAQGMTFMEKINTSQK